MKTNILTDILMMLPLGLIAIAGIVAGFIAAPFITASIIGALIIVILFSIGLTNLAEKQLSR